MLQNVARSAALEIPLHRNPTVQILNSNCVDNLLGSYVHAGIMIFL